MILGRLDEELKNWIAAAANMPAENDEGDTEYKLKLTNISADKRQKRATQMSFRITEGGGEATYVIGVRDNGEAIGISQDDLTESLLNLELIA